MKYHEKSIGMASLYLNSLPTLQVYSAAFQGQM